MKTFKRDANGRVIKDSDFYSVIGAKGGNQTKKRMLAKNPNYYSEIGDLGGAAVLKKHGKKYMASIGKMRGANAWKAKEDAHAR